MITYKPPKKKRYRIIATCYDKHGRKLSEGINSYTKTHPIQKHFAELVGEPAKIYLHAEIQAILRAGDKQIHRINISNVSGAWAEPCKICQAAIKAYGISRITVESTNFTYP